MHAQLLECPYQNKDKNKGLYEERRRLVQHNKKSQYNVKHNLHIQHDDARPAKKLG